MTATEDDYLKVGLPYFTPELFTDEAIARIRSLAQGLPPFSVAGFECRLGEQQPVVDFSVALPCAPFQVPPSFLTHPVWKSIDQLCREWMKSDTLLHQRVDKLWLEFDLHESPASIPLPALVCFLHVNPNTTAAALATVAHQMDEALPIEALMVPLQRCLASLPTGARLSHLGIMRSRPNAPLRVNVGPMALPEIPHYLHRLDLGWQDPTQGLSLLVEQLGAFLDTVSLSLDLQDRLRPRIGLECGFRPYTDAAQRLQRLLDQLVSQGLCTPSKRQALMAWPGFIRQAECRDRWPQNLQLGDLLLANRMTSLFAREVSHIKLTYCPAPAAEQTPERSGAIAPTVEAKAYLAYGHHWLEMSPSEGAASNAVDSVAIAPSPPPQAADACRVPDPTAFLEQTSHYYDQVSPVYLQAIGRTYQAGLLQSGSSGQPSAQTSNLQLAQRAGIQPGWRVLDAGCGLCGPAVDIAQAIDNVCIDAVTLSAVQAQMAKEWVQQLGLDQRIRVWQGDYHRLAFADNVFNIALFFESVGYAYSLPQLFAEMYRLLSPGGTLYLKDVFRLEPPLSPQQQKDLETFDRIFAQRTPALSEVEASIRQAGFIDLDIGHLNESISTHAFNQAMVTYEQGRPQLTEFGKSHFWQFQTLPILFAEIKAMKPALF